MEAADRLGTLFVFAAWAIMRAPGVRRRERHFVGVLRTPQVSNARPQTPSHK